MCSRIHRIRKTTITWIGSLAAGLLVCGTAHAQLVADSVDDFSGVQGQGGWFYGYYDGDVVLPYTPADFALFPTYDVGQNGGEAYWHLREGDGGYFTIMRASRCHPNGRFTSGGRVPIDHWVVRRWVSPVNGSVRVHASFTDLNSTCGNGVRAHIYLGSQQVYTDVVTSIVPREFNMDLCVSIGTIIDFCVDPLDSWDSCDNTGAVFTISGPIIQHPEETRTCLGGTASFSVGVRGTEHFTYVWRKDKLPLQDGQHYSGATTNTLTVLDARVADEGAYDCVVSVCGGAFASDEAQLRLCYADYNCDGVVNSQDFFDFIRDFMMLNVRVDYINHDGYVNSQDYFQFIQAFFAGCP